MQIDLPKKTYVQNKQNCCSLLKVFFEFGSTHVPCVCPDKLDRDQSSQYTIDPLDMKDANVLIDIINSEVPSTEAQLFWMGDQGSSTEDWVYETDVHDWPHQSHNFTPIFIEEFIMKTNRTDKIHCTRIALFQMYGTVFYWGRMYEDKNYKEGEWSLNHFHYFQLGFRNDVERFIEQYLKIFSLSSSEPVQCTYVRPNRLPHTITLFKQHEDGENRKRKPSRKDPAGNESSLRAQKKPCLSPRVRRQPLKPKQARVVKPRVKKMKPCEKLDVSEVPNSINTVQEHYLPLPIQLKQHPLSAIGTPNYIPHYGDSVEDGGPNILNIVEQYGQSNLKDGLNTPQNSEEYEQSLLDDLKVANQEFEQSLGNVQDEKIDLCESKEIVIKQEVQDNFLQL
ncbi:hypothetical protein WDU94_012061 [Cyamophila willieti]